VSAFTFYVTCMQCGGPLEAVRASDVHPVEAVVRVVCSACRAGATLRVLYANRTETPVDVRSIEP
jgi:hypothetical protein